jgi:hypothetical protein
MVAVAFTAHLTLSHWLSDFDNRKVLGFSLDGLHEQGNWISG